MASKVAKASVRRPAAGSSSGKSTSVSKSTTGGSSGGTGWGKSYSPQGSSSGGVGSSAGVSAGKVSSGGSSGGTLTGSNVKYGGTSPGYSGASGSSGGYSGSVDYHKQASDAAARGDWAAVEKALAARQAKIDAQGGNDRGTSNQQILSQLRSQYGGSYNSLPSGARDRVSLAAGEKLPFTAYDGAQGSVYRDKGWQDGVDYLSQASQYARSGDLDAAYDALMRRGFKMNDTGSSGGGTSQDQAYALIHRLYNDSPGAQQSYQNKLDANRKALQEHQTVFGLETRPELAYKQFKSADGRYWILYDGQGRPSAAKPVSSRLGDGKTRYSQEEIDLMSRYYGGTGDRAELERQLHNLAVARTGNGRLVDQSGNWASGSEVPVGSARDWNGLPTERNTNQDTAALRELLDRINTGETAGSPAEVPLAPPRNTGAGLLAGSGTPSGGAQGWDSGGAPGGGYGGDDLSGYLQQMYRQNLESQLAQLRAAYEQNLAGFRAHDDLIAQAYRDRQNQAAGQNDLQRMYLAEMGLGQGLNTGAAGQLALAQSAAYQGALADLWAAEGQDRAANDLEMRKLAAGYQGDMAAAAAQSNSQLAGALYNEYVRQIQAAEAQRQAELENARWLAQFQYQQDQDAWERQKWQTQWDYGQQADRQSTAYKLASALLENGVLPDSSTLAAAGISAGDAQSYVNAVQAQLAAQAARSSKSSGSAGGSRSAGGTSSSGKPKMTLAQAKSAIEAGQVTDAVRTAYDYYMGSGAFEQFYGGEKTGRAEMNPEHYRAFVQSVIAQLESGKRNAASGNLNSRWAELSDRQRQGIRVVLDRYQFPYRPAGG